MKFLFLTAISIVLCVSAHAGNNPCVKAARAAVSHDFHVQADLDQDEKQPVGSGKYLLVIWKNECYFDVSVKMKLTSPDSCEASAKPVLDTGSANCS